MTVRLAETGGYVPCLQDVLFEFIDENGVVFPLKSIEEGKEYDVIISQLGGFYRYRIGDRVRVTHFFKKTPCLEFIGRSDTISDIAGEKLNEAFARKCIDEIFDESNAFALLLPHAKRGERPFYYLVTNQDLPSSDQISQRLDDALSKAFHYRNARQSGKLESIKIQSHQYARELFIRYYDKKGMKLEDMNSCVLVKDIAQSHEFINLIQKQR